MQIRMTNPPLVPRVMMETVSLCVCLWGEASLGLLRLLVVAYMTFLLTLFIFFEGGWGSSNQDGGTWAPADTSDNNDSAAANNGSSMSSGVSVKREQPTSNSASSAMEAHMGDGEETAVWFMERVCVQIKNGEKSAVIKEINADKSALVELKDGSTQTIRVDDVSRVQPVEKDMVLVIGGADVGVEGELVCIDGSDAILKDSNEDFKIVDFVHLAKIAGEG